ncbi:MAG: hypothetical protein WAR37_00325 [Candidatus Microsaccharimonas sp.]
MTNPFTFVEENNFRKTDGSLEFDSEQYFEWESTGSGLTVRWSAEAGLSEAVKVFRSSFGEEDPEIEGTITIGTDRLIRPSFDIARIALARPDDVRFYSVEHDRTGVSWSPGDEHAGHGHIALRTNYSELEQASPLIRQTATPEVALFAPTAVRSLVEFGK